MEKRVYYKYLFIIGAFWNWIIGIIGLLTNTGLSGETLLYYQGFILSTIIFGIGYFMVGANLDKNHGIVIMGIIGKVLVFIFLLAYYFLGVLNIDIVILGTGDLIFAFLFLEFLVKGEE